MTLVAGCAVNPATGKQDFTPFMSPAQETAVGAEQHPRLLEAFGGAYTERPDLSAYVSELGRRLQATSEMPRPPFTFTVVNSDQVNAFALPGGYVYVTRGLMALANSEAEIAGVIAHEIGHVTGRHTAQRYSRGVLAQLGAAVVGMATGSSAIGNLANVTAAAYVQGFSRGQELEADQLGIRYLRRADYDPRAMAGFLSSLQAESALAGHIAGREGAEPEASLFSSHPRTMERVAAAGEAAHGATGGAMRTGREAYLERIDGLLYGDDPEQGLRRGRVFIHPGLGFRFEVPPGFRLRNAPEAVFAVDNDGSAIRFDAGTLDRDMAMSDYLGRVWLPDVALDSIEDIAINGMDAATGATRANTREGPRDVRAVAIRFDAGLVYRFLMVTPTGATARLSEGLRRMTYSFRPLSPDEAAGVRPRRLRIHRVEPGDTIETLARRLPFDDFRVERFRTLNGLGPDDSLTPGQLVKLISE